MRNFPERHVLGVLGGGLASFLLSIGLDGKSRAVGTISAQARPSSSSIHKVW